MPGKSRGKGQGASMRLLQAAKDEARYAFAVISKLLEDEKDVL